MYSRVKFNVVYILPCSQVSPVHSVVQLHTPGAVQFPPFRHRGLHTAIYMQTRQYNHFRPSEVHFLATLKLFEKSHPNLSFITIQLHRDSYPLILGTTKEYM